MRTVQLSIFLENRTGRLSEILNLLGINNFNIRALSLADTSDFGILRLVINEPDRASALLLEHGFTTGKTDVVAVEFEDRPGALAKLLFLLAPHDINIEYMYACARKEPDNAIMIFRFDKTEEAIKILMANNYSLPVIVKSD